MTTKQAAGDFTLISLNQNWQDQIRNQLASNENALAVLEVDLDAKLNFRRGILVLTESRLLSYSPADGGDGQFFGGSASEGTQHPQEPLDFGQEPKEEQALR